MKDRIIICLSFLVFIASVYVIWERLESYLSIPEVCRAPYKKALRDGEVVVALRVKDGVCVVYVPHPFCKEAYKRAISQGLQVLSMYAREDGICVLHTREKKERKDVLLQTRPYMARNHSGHHAGHDALHVQAGLQRQ